NDRCDELRVTVGSYSFDISHHNRKCFNPEHLVVESRTINGRRQACNGHKILVHDDFSYHPCSHGSIEKMRKCILPLQRMEGIMQNSDEQPSTEATPAPALQDTATTINNTDADKLTNGLCVVTLTKPHVRPSLHHLALIADNGAAELKWPL
ncbi:uncharacterized protein V1513DRAFT_386107, partial [Lipomyces chichibuensis]|uniref:uncharacterized protein n=1 Tax=Lipomyces chichibuensis TaxID=1546026 RepID=UPI00334320BE